MVATTQRNKNLHQRQGDEASQFALGEEVAPGEPAMEGNTNSHPETRTASTNSLTIAMNNAKNCAQNVNEECLLGSKHTPIAHVNEIGVTPDTTTKDMNKDK